MTEDAIRLEPVRDSGWLNDFLDEHWGAPGVVTRGVLHAGSDLRAVRAMDDRECVGLISWSEASSGWQIVSLDALRTGQGIGRRLLATVTELARRHEASRLWLITTNDNLDALRFYQRLDWRIVAVHRDAIAASRKIKPTIPAIGHYGIPIRDEIELEITL